MTKFKFKHLPTRTFSGNTSPPKHAYTTTKTYIENFDNVIEQAN